MSAELVQWLLGMIAAAQGAQFLMLIQLKAQVASIKTKLTGRIE